MKDKTQANLSTAFAGESQAHMKYKAFADKAAREGLPNIARLFQAVSYAEQVHATNHLRTLGQINATADNLQAALSGENYEVSEMYPSHIAASEQEGEKAATRSQTWALEAEKTHAVLYGQAQQAVQGGGDATFGPIQICGNCGWTVIGEAPDICPICKAKREMFRAF